MKWSFRWNPKPAQEALITLARDAQLDAARFLAERARQLAPVDTGLLKSSIFLVSVGKELRMRVVAEAPYAQWVEFGHLAGGVTWVAPNPFMRTALADTAKAFPGIVKDQKLGRPGGDSGALDLNVSFSVTT
jgi:hypothetical protein